MYHRCLLQMQAEDRLKASSEQLVELAGVNAAKVRKDLLASVSTTSGEWATTSISC